MSVNNTHRLAIVTPKMIHMKGQIHIPL